MFGTTMPLLQFQKVGYNKLHQLKVGALFMEMGTGKTRLYLELAANKINRGKADHIIILSQVSSLLHTKEEVLKHTNLSPSDVTIYHDRYDPAPSVVNIMGIESMSSSMSAYDKMNSMIEGSVLVIDESHMIKNRDALRSRNINEIARKTDYRFLSTGTPMPNGVEDLYWQFYTLAPQILGYRHYREFENVHLGYALRMYGKTLQYKTIARYNTDIISNKIAPYTFEVKKSDCLDLPPKTYSFASAYMDDDTDFLYAEAKRRILYGKDAFEADDATIYRLLLALHQISSGIVPKVLAEDFPEMGNPKIDVLKQQVRLLPKGERVVIFVSYLAELEAAKRCLVSEGYKVYTISGDVPVNTRHELIKQFKSDGGILIATTATGGQSIDLSFAHYVIYMSNRFNYKDRVQSEDRIHRIGMTGNAHYIDIRMECGIEKMINRSLKRKENAAQKFLEQIRYLRNLKTDEARKQIDEKISSL